MKTPAPERAAGRRKALAKGQALPGTGGGAPSFPIPNVDYLKRAIRSVGRAPASKRPALAALIRKRAKELKATNAPGVKGTWAFQGAGDGPALELSTPPPRRMPMVRGPADVQMSRTGPGVITVMHKSTGMKVGTITPAGRGYAATHASGVKTAASGSQQGALAGLIAAHNRIARGAKPGAGLPPAQQMGAAVMPGVKTYASGQQEALDFAGALPHTTGVASSASDGPRVTSMGTGKPAATRSGTQAGLTPYAAGIYAKLRRKGIKPDAALAMAKRAAAMHAKATAKAAA